MISSIALLCHQTWLARNTPTKRGLNGNIIFTRGVYQEAMSDDAGGH